MSKYIWTKIIAYIRNFEGGIIPRYRFNMCSMKIGYEETTPRTDVSASVDVGERVYEFSRRRNPRVGVGVAPSVRLN